MQIEVRVGASQEAPSELIVVNLCEGVTEPTGATGAVDRALGGAIRELIASGDLKGRKGETAVLYTRGAIPARRVMVAGLGPREKLTADGVRQVAAEVARAVRKLGVRRYHSIVHGAGAGGLDLAVATQALVEGTILGDYVYVGAKTDTADLEPRLEALTVAPYAAEDEARVRVAADAGRAIAEAVCLARDLGNRPANLLTPALLAELAADLAAQHGLACTVLGRDQMAELGMGALLGVAQGSAQPPKFVVLEHNAGQPALDTYVIVGKGITFDSGGISLKPSDGMEQMKYDMSGAAVTLGVLRAVAELRLPLHVVGLIPATENLPSGTAYKPGDVLTSMAGLSIEVISTDAEGRLILADALAYARRYAPKAVVDLATLTGACVVALGHVTTGLMGNNPDLLQALKAAADATGEKAWELPLYDEYAEQIKSDVADVKNTGGRPAGAITAGLFLSKFATAYPWAHLDIAGTAWADKTAGYQIKGATGRCVRLLVHWLQGMSAH
ncbi:MAG: leucyl aminopeptidase [Chloroflexota bacterium]